MTASNATETHSDKAPRARLWVNWLLALSTILGAVGVQLFAMGAVMSTSACSAPDCPKPSGFVYGLLTYGAPVVVVARHRGVVLHRGAPARVRGAAGRVGAVDSGRRNPGGDVLRLAFAREVKA